MAVSTIAQHIASEHIINIYSCTGANTTIVLVYLGQYCKLISCKSADTAYLTCMLALFMCTHRDAAARVADVQLPHLHPALHSPAALGLGGGALALAQAVAGG